MFLVLFCDICRHTVLADSNAIFCTQMVKQVLRLNKFYSSSAVLIRSQYWDLTGSPLSTSTRQCRMFVVCRMRQRATYDCTFHVVCMQRNCRQCCSSPYWTRVVSVLFELIIGQMQNAKQYCIFLYLYLFVTLFSQLSTLYVYMPLQCYIVV